MDNKHIKVLLIEDNPGDARLMRETLAEVRGAPFDLEWADRLSTGLKRLAAGGIDVVLLDLSLPDSQRFDTFAKAQAQAPEVPIVVLTGLDDEALAVKAVRGGAQDYLVKGHVDGNLLVRAMSYAIERKRTEEALRRSEAQARHLLEFQNKVIDTADVWVDLLDVEGNVTLWNRAAELISGYSREEVVGHKKIWEWLYPDPNYRAEIFAQAKKTIERGERVENDETTIRCKDGTLKTIRWYDNSILDERGKPVGSIAVGIDITEIKKAQEKVRESEEKFRSLVQTIPECVYSALPNGEMLYMSPAVKNIFGYSAEEFQKDNNLWIRLIHEDDQKELLMKLEKLLKKGVPYVHEFRMKRKDGNIVWIRDHANAMLDEKGKPTKISGTIYDITERKKMEEELRKHTEHLEELVEERTRELREAERMAAIGKTAGMVGHDLRNPLQAMINTLYLAKEKLEFMPSPERQGVKELLKTLEEQVEYMNKIVSDLQDYARPVKPEPVPTSLPQLINDALSTITVPENVRVSKVIEEDSPKLMVDPALMRRVFTNLIINALQAMPEGGQLTIRSSKTGETAFMSVQDTGVGIPKEDLDKLFRPLFTTKSKGQGFGLPVCKRLVEAHDGSITAESKLGRGSTFTVKIPLRREVS